MFNFNDRVWGAGVGGMGWEGWEFGVIDLQRGNLCFLAGWAWLGIMVGMGIVDSELHSQE